MNPLLNRLQPYPFERLRQLFAGVTPNPALQAISLGIGEPRHATPDFIKQAMAGALDKGLAGYPATAGEPALRNACADWMQRRYGLAVDPATQVLPVLGSREALFSLTQTVVDSSRPGATVVCPNPFYQIYEGAALLAGATPYYAPSDPARNFRVDWDSVPEAVWARTQLLSSARRATPPGAVMPLAEWERLVRPVGPARLCDCVRRVLQRNLFPRRAAAGRAGSGPPSGAHGLPQPDRMFTSLSKRSNVPGLRSGFVAGDAR
jgi:N-succinyldiaminopimelate aminotransferase